MLTAIKTLDNVVIIKKLLVVFSLLGCASYSNAELVQYGDDLQYDDESILLLKNPPRVAFTTYYKLEANKFLKSNIVLNCDTQTYYSSGANSILDKNFKYLYSFSTKDTPTKDHPRDLTKYSLPHLIYELHCTK